MKNIELNETQLASVKRIGLDILNDIDRICRENGINYSLAYGTLLGGIRHHVFIPWDDDIDLMMLREDYDKFIKIAPIDLNEKFYLLTHDLYNGYGLFFAKVMAKKTLMKEITNAKVDAPAGVFVDVFPLDNFPDDLEEQKKIYKRIKILKRVSAFKLNYDHGQKGLHRAVFRIRKVLYTFFSLQIVRDKYSAILEKYKDASFVKEVCNFSGVYGIQKDTYYKEWFEEYENIKFENLTVKVISRYYDRMENTMINHNDTSSGGVFRKLNKVIAISNIFSCVFEEVA